MCFFFPILIYVEFGFWSRSCLLTVWQISIRSSTKKHSPLYNLRVQYKTPSGKVLEDKVIETPFTTWFSADGAFHPEPLREWLAAEIEVLGLAAKETVKKTGGASSSVAPEDAGDEGVTKRR